MGTRQAGVAQLILAFSHACQGGYKIRRAANAPVRCGHMAGFQHSATLGGYLLILRTRL